MSMSRQKQNKSLETEFIRIEDKELEYYHYLPDAQATVSQTENNVSQTEENVSQTTLIFLHEGLGCTVLWRDFPKLLADATGCATLVYSRAGYGQSDPVALPRPSSYMHEEAKNVLPKLIEALGIGNHILVGHSDGASIALIYAGAEPRPKLKAVISEAAHVFVEDLSVASIRAVQEPYNSVDAGLRDKLAKYHKHVDNAFWGWNDVWLSDDFRQWNIENYLNPIKVPVLAIQGYDDQYGTEKQIESILKNCANASSLMLDDCAHNPHKEQKELVLEAMKDFVNQNL